MSVFCEAAERQNLKIIIMMDKDLKKLAYDKVEYTWLRYVLLFMIQNKKFRAKWFLWLFRNWTSHIAYKNGKVTKFPLKHFSRFM